jgi:hypothetical protein
MKTKLVILQVNILLFFSFGLVFYVNGQEKLTLTKEADEARMNVYEKQLADYLSTYLVDEYQARAAKAWNRDYSSIDALKRSVEPNRRRWEKVIKPLVLQKSGPLQKHPILYRGSGCMA